MRQSCAVRRLCHSKQCQQGAHGKTAHRELHKAELRTPKGKRAIGLLVTSSLLPYAKPPRVLLVLEDLDAFSNLTKSGRSPQQRRTTGN